MGALLSIAIPTFDRNEILQRNVAPILAQLIDGVDLLVIDNHSPRPVALSQAHANARVVRNAVNIGGNANILRCFELAEAEWIWVLGDDDTIVPDGVTTALRAIAEHPQAIIINFSTAGAFCRNASFSCTGRREMLAKLDDFGNALFISSSLFNRKRLLDCLQYGYQYAYSCAPHLAMLFMACDELAQSVFRSERIVTWTRPAVENRGSLMVIAVGLPSLLELPLEDDEARLLARLLAKFPRISAVAHEVFLLMVLAGRPRRSLRARFERIVTALPWWSSLTRRLAGAVWYTLLLAPSISYYCIVRPLYRWKTGEASGAHKLKREHL